jgi:hypothetical protein
MEDRYALVALRIAAPLLQELIDEGMGAATETAPSNAVLEQQAILDSSSYWGFDYGSLRNGEP